ncbi:MAG: hypothetical protein IJH25_04455, partial [Clostridia bacterium]|nr:hypothetical protein [Clostridia bacterium]
MDYSKIQIEDQYITKYLILLPQYECILSKCYHIYSVSLYYYEAYLWRQIAAATARCGVVAATISRHAVFLWRQIAAATARCGVVAATISRHAS